MQTRSSLRPPPHFRKRLHGVVESRHLDDIANHFHIVVSREGSPEQPKPNVLFSKLTKVSTLSRDMVHVLYSLARLFVILRLLHGPSCPSNMLL